jgi:endonuclease/exonuclease/phosphatase family metal-dependent hydrolase
MTTISTKKKLGTHALVALILCSQAACAEDALIDEGEDDGLVSAELENTDLDLEDREANREPYEPVTEADVAAAAASASFSAEDQAAFDANPEGLPGSAPVVATYAAQAAGAQNVRVMTWNGQTQHHGPGEWVRVVGNQRPDVLAMQEVCVREVKELVKKLKDTYNLSYYIAYGSVRKSYDRGCGKLPTNSGAWGNAMLSKFPVRSLKNALYAKQAKDGQKRGYHAMTVTFPGGAGVRFFNTHIALEKDAQGAQVAQLAKEADGFAKAVVLGDLNLKPDRTELRPLTSAFSEVDPDNKSPTFKNDPEDAKKKPTSKIDYIYLKGVVKRAAVETYWTASSDHRPKIVTVR